MKKLFLYVLAISVLSVVACKKEEKKTELVGAPTEQTSKKVGESYAVQITDSKIDWEGSKVSGDKHTGNLALKDGNLLMNNGKLVGGTIIIDMNSISVTDITDAEMKAKLEGHLKGIGGDAEAADHFFNVAKYPTASLTIKNVSEKEGKTIVDGELIIKGKANAVSFPVTIDEVNGIVTLTAESITIDRTKWGVNYSSGSVVKDLAADKIIKDEIVLKAKVVAKK